MHHKKFLTFLIYNWEMNGNSVTIMVRKHTGGNNMGKKKISKIVVASVATVAGVFGGIKLYVNRKKRAEEPKQIGDREPVRKQEEETQA